MSSYRIGNFVEKVGERYHVGSCSENRFDIAFFFFPLYGVIG